MRLDASLAFIPLGSPLSCVGATGATFYGQNIVDFLGTGVGTAPQAIIGTPSVYGQADAMGVGSDRIEMAVAVGAAFVTSDSATLTVALQGAPDQGATGSYQPGTWQTFVQSPAMTAAQLTINQVIFRFPWLPPFPFNERPRFLRLAFITPASTQFSAGTIAYALPSTGRDDWSAAYAAKNYVIA